VLYTGAHLERLGSDADGMCALLSPHWRRAWESSDAGLAGFANDVDRAFRVVRQERRTDLAMFCFLLKASIRSISHRLPATLVRRLLEESIWRPKQAIAYARTIVTSPEHVELLAAVSQLVEQDERVVLLDEARAAAGALEGRDRARAFLSLVRAGDPLAPFLQHGGYGWEDLWLAAAKELVTTGRLEEAESLCGFEPIAVSNMFTRWLIGSRQFEALRRLLTRRHTIAIDAETDWQLFFLGEQPDVWPGLPHQRIQAAHADLLAGRPVRLTTLDLQWLHRLFDCWDFSGIIAESAYGFAQALSPPMQHVFSRMLQSSFRLARRAVLVEPEAVRDRQLRELLVRLDGVQLRTVIEEVMPALRGELLELAVERLAAQGTLKSEDCRNIVGQLVARDAPALRRAVMRLEESDQKLMLLCAAADADEEGRPDFVRRIHAALTRLTPTQIFESYLDMVARHLDGTVLRAIVGALSRLSDEPDIELARFLVTPERFTEPPCHAAAEDLGLLAACMSSETMPRILRWLIEAAPLQQPAVLDLLIATRVPADAAGPLRQSLWARMQSVLPAVIDAIPLMQHPPSPKWRAAIPRDVRKTFRSLLRRADDSRLVALSLLEPDSPILRNTIKHFGTDWIAHYPLRHVVDVLSSEERMLILSGNPTAHAILALGSQAGRADMHQLSARLFHRATPEQLCAMLPFVDRPRQEAVVRELLSGANLHATAPLIRDVLLGIWVEALPLHLAAMQEALVAALTPSEIVRITRALATRPEIATLVVGIHRCAPLAPAVLSQVLDVLLDTARPVTRRAALRDVAAVISILRSSEPPDRELRAIDRAVNIFP
jgi:hypothetical protein